MPINTIILILLILIFLIVVLEFIKKLKKDQLLWKCLKWKLIWFLIFLGILIISNLRVILADIIFMSSQIYNVEILWHSIISFEIGDYQHSVVFFNDSAIIGLVGSFYWGFKIFRCRKEQK